VPSADHARAYLHANCSHCHRKRGPADGKGDLRFAIPLLAMQVCDVVPSSGELGIADARIIAPGAPERSVLSRRMHELGSERMPPMASVKVDTSGVEWVDRWIAGLAPEACDQE
jgi:hypothetical protein